MKPVAYFNIYKGNGENWVSKKRPTSFDCDMDSLTITPLYAIDFTKYKLVPIEPTEEMVKAMEDLPTLTAYTKKGLYLKLGRAMLEASPSIEDIKDI